MKRFTSALWRFLLAATLCCASAGADGLTSQGVANGSVAPRRGVLVLAHGGSRSWNRTVRRTVEAARLGAPSQIAFGMGFHRSEAEAMQRAVDRLEQQGVQEIVAVPLFVSSASEVFRQLEYLLGKRPTPAVTREFLHSVASHAGHGPYAAGDEPSQPVTTRAQIQLTPPLDDDPTVIEIMTTRALALSRAPAGETVLLVAHGPNEDADNTQWLACMGRIAQAVQQRAGFRRVAPITLRDDAEGSVKAEATAALRAAVEAASNESEVLVVPLLIARGGIESGIPARLRGLRYRYSGETLLPDERISRWLRQRALER